MDTVFASVSIIKYVTLNYVRGPQMRYLFPFYRYIPVSVSLYGITYIYLYLYIYIFIYIRR